MFGSPGSHADECAFVVFGDTELEYEGPSARREPMLINPAPGFPLEGLSARKLIAQQLI
jgi:hypothetical protein